jgi:hypothetical protein
MSVVLIKHHTNEDPRRSEGIALPFLATVLDGSKWSASSPGRFTSREMAPGQVVPGPVRTRKRREESFEPVWNQTPVSRPAASHYTSDLTSI